MGIAPQQLGELVEQHARALVLYARGWCEIPEDVVQETFLKLAQQHRVPEPLLPWLYRVTRHGAISASRSQQRRRRREIRAASGECWFQSDDQRLDAEGASEALRELPLPLREAVIARIWGELTYEEIATLTNVSVATAYRRYTQGIDLLRERMNVPCQTTRE